MNVYWYDIQHHNLSTILIFGKTEQNVNVCLRVPKLKREIYFLIQPNIIIEDCDIIKQEIDDFLKQKCNILYYETEFVNKYNIFNKTSSISSDTLYGHYVKVKFEYQKYSKHQKQQFASYKGGNYCSKIFGIHQDPIQLFILQHKLMGPSWIHIDSFQEVSLEIEKLSWCEREYIITSSSLLTHIDPIIEIQIPTFSLSSFHIKTNLKQEIILCTIINTIIHIENTNEYCTTNDNTTKTFVNQSKMTHLSSIQPEIEECKNEKDLLLRIISHLQSSDIIVTYNTNINYSILLSRIVYFGIHEWSKIGQLKISLEQMKQKQQQQQQTDNDFKVIIPGKIFIDVHNSTEEYLTSQPNYTLSYLSKMQLNTTYPHQLASDINIYLQSEELNRRLIQINHIDTYITLQLLFKLQIIQLTKYMTNICGNLWSRTVKTIRSERATYYLLHDFYNLNYILPEPKEYINNNTDVEMKIMDDNNDKKQNEPNNNNTNNKRSQPQYSGGKVLEPKKGYYQTFILLLDYNSLYPSIIQEYNICFTTVEYWKDNNNDGVPDPNIPLGRLPKLISMLVKRRKDVQRTIKSETDKNKIKQLNIRQKALKLIANTIYGVLGFQNSLFYCKNIAALITRLGRNALLHAVDIAENQLNLDIIYGDTDSIFINTKESEDINKAIQIGNQLKQEINKIYKVLEIDIESIFKKLLLYEKKKSAALKIINYNTLQTEYEFKGIDMVRRDWCQLVKDIDEIVIQYIFKNEYDSLRSYLKSIPDLVKQCVDIEQFIITKGLGQSIDKYNKDTHFPHVHAALQLEKKGFKVKVNDFIPYLILDAPVDEFCNSNVSLLLNEDQTKLGNRSIHPLFFDPTIHHIDYRYYLTTQIAPTIDRLCIPIHDIITSTEIFTYLGLLVNNNNNNNIIIETSNNIVIDLDLISTDIIKCIFCQSDLNNNNNNLKCLQCDEKKITSDDIIKQIPDTMSFMNLIQYESMFMKLCKENESNNKIYQPVLQHILHIQLKYHSTEYYISLTSLFK